MSLSVPSIFITFLYLINLKFDRRIAVNPRESVQCELVYGVYYNIIAVPLNIP